MHGAPPLTKQTRVAATRVGFIIGTLGTNNYAHRNRPEGAGTTHAYGRLLLRMTAPSIVNTDASYLPRSSRGVPLNSSKPSEPLNTCSFLVTTHFLDNCPYTHCPLIPDRS